MHSRSVFLCMTGHYNFYVCMYVCMCALCTVIFPRKIFSYSITSVGHGGDSGFLAVSPQLT